MIRFCSFLQILFLRVLYLKAPTKSKQKEYIQSEKRYDPNVESKRDVIVLCIRKKLIQLNVYD